MSSKEPVIYAGICYKLDQMVLIYWLIINSVIISVQRRFVRWGSDIAMVINAKRSIRRGNRRFGGRRIVAFDKRIGIISGQLPSRNVSLACCTALYFLIFSYFLFSHFTIHSALLLWIIKNSIINIPIYRFSNLFSLIKIVSIHFDHFNCNDRLLLYICIYWNILSGLP